MSFSPSDDHRRGCRIIANFGLAAPAQSTVAARRLAASREFGHSFAPKGHLAGFGLQSLLPASYVAASKGMIASVVGLDATLLALVLGLLIWTSHGLFNAQQSQLQTIGRAIIQLDLAFNAYGPEAAPGRAELRKHHKRARARLRTNDPHGRRFVVFADLPAEVLPMRAVFASLRPIGEEQRQNLATARDLFATIVDTQVTMMRSLVDPVPNLLLNVVLGWSCVLFFGYGLQSTMNALTAVMAALGAVSVGSAAFLILELSDPYERVGFDRQVHILAERGSAQRRRASISWRTAPNTLLEDIKRGR